MKTRILEFGNNFLSALTNSKSGHSLKKWLAIGTFWLMCKVVLDHTNDDNLVTVAGILSGLIVTLMGINQAGKYFSRKAEVTPTEEPKI